MNLKTFNTVISNIPNPVGLDLEIGTLQFYLAQLGWIEKVYGIAHSQKRTKSEGESVTTEREGLRGTARFDLYYPQGFDYGSYGGGIETDLSFNDSYSSRVFFLNTEDAQTNTKVDKWDTWGKGVQIEQPVALIFHCNLNSLQASSTEYLKNSILSALIQCPKFIGEKMFEDMQSVWKEFTITPELNGITRFPNYCLRIDGKITYQTPLYNIAWNNQTPP